MAKTYAERREYQNNYLAQKSLTARDIAPLPQVQNKRRRNACKKDFKKFCLTYFPETFYLGFSPDHLKAISKIETAVIDGGLFALAMPRGSGKALYIHTPILTTNGFKTMASLNVGDYVYDELGNSAKVLYKSEVFYNHECYKLTFNNHETIIADAEHLWQVEDISKRKNPIVLKTMDIAKNYIRTTKRGYLETRYRIPINKPLVKNEIELPINPYVLGVWLGDGTSSTSNLTLNANDSEEIIEKIESCGEITKKYNYKQGNSFTIGLTKTRKNDCFQVRLRKLGILSNKHIPEVYLNSSIDQRLNLLRGIMDTDGYVNNGICNLIIKNNLFADNFEFLLSSLGIKYTRTSKKTILNNKEFVYNFFYFVSYKDFSVFSLTRKYNKQKIRKEKTINKQGVLSHEPAEVLTITKVEKVKSVPTQCIMVDSPSHLYLAGKKLIPTHNTTLTEKACIWALLYGHRSFICLVGASETAAQELLASIKIEFESNDRLLEDFPEVCYPIRRLDGISNRSSGQLYNGTRTRIIFSAAEIVLPTIAGSVASGSTIKCAGITGRIRGMKHARADGTNIRPDLVVIDDPQTNESANSAEQTRKRVQILQSDILGLAGPGKKISGVMPCTVISADDMADRILDKQKNPAWQGERFKLLYEFPQNKQLWEQYEVIRANSLREQGNISDATEFYRKHRKEMDVGAKPAWAERFNPDEISAVQNCMNLLFQDKNSFFSEMQNEPITEEANTENHITEEILVTRLNGLPKSKVPLSCNRLTMFIDVQKPALFYVICAWDDCFMGSIIEYGTYPEQNLPHYTLANLRKTLQKKYPSLSLEAQLYEGLEALTLAKLSQEFQREDGTTLHIERCIVDANWGDSTEVVYKFCRQSAFSAILMPSHGKGITASSKSINEYRRSAGDRFGYNWYIPRGAGKRALRHIIYDTNFWKSFICNRLNIPHGEKGNLSIYGTSQTNHDVLFDQLQAEYKVRTEGRGRIVDEWKLKPNRDNHFLDCLVGCAVGASLAGCTIPEVETGKPKRQRISLKEKLAGNSTPVSESAVEEAATPTIGATGRLSLKELLKAKRK